MLHRSSLKIVPNRTKGARLRRAPPTNVRKISVYDFYRTFKYPVIKIKSVQIGQFNSTDRKFRTFWSFRSDFKSWKKIPRAMLPLKTGLFRPLECSATACFWNVAVGFWFMHISLPPSSLTFMKGRHQRQEMVTQNYITSMMTRPQKLFNFRETETSTLKLNEMRYEEKLYYFESQSFDILLIQFSNGIPYQKTFEEIKILHTYNFSSNQSFIIRRCY